MTPKVLIAVMSHTVHADVPEHASYVRLEAAIRDTWLPRTKNALVYDYAPANALRYDSDRRTLFVPYTQNDLKAVGTDKTVKAFRWMAANLQFDFLFRTNLGSFVYEDRLTDWLTDKPATCYYAGYYEKVRYASGAGILLSHDMVRAIGNSSAVPRLVDDAAILAIMSRLGVNVQPGKRMNFKNGSITEHVAPDQSQPDRSRPHYHWRLRSADRNADAAMMRELCASL